MSELCKRLEPYLDSNRPQMGQFVLMSFLGGFGAARLRHAVVLIATAIAAGDDRVPISIGSLPEWEVSIGRLFAGSFLLILVVIGVALASAVLTARMSVAALTSARRRTFGAFIAASWDLQSREWEGHRQELLTTHAKRISVGAIALGNGITAASSFVKLLASALFLHSRRRGHACHRHTGAVLPHAAADPADPVEVARASGRRLQYAMSVTQAAALPREIRAFDVTRVGHALAQRSELAIVDRPLLVYQEWAECKSTDVRGMKRSYITVLSRYAGLPLPPDREYARAMQLTEYRRARRRIPPSWAGEVESWMAPYRQSGALRGDGQMPCRPE